MPAGVLNLAPRPLRIFEGLVVQLRPAEHADPAAPTLQEFLDEQVVFGSIVRTTILLPSLLIKHFPIRYYCTRVSLSIPDIDAIIVYNTVENNEAQL